MALGSILVATLSCQGEPDPNKGVTPRESFQRIIGDLMAKWSIPGGGVTLTKDEKLIMAEGYGLADKSTSQPAAAGSLFRIASVSKPITAVTILKLYEEGLLGLDEKAFKILEGLEPLPGGVVDPRIYQITIRDLLQHSGGWDSSLSGDPMFKSREIAQAMGVPPPADARTIIRYMMGQPLDFAPGEKYAYSNFGYCVLGRIIERVTGLSYEDSVKTRILEPMQIKRMRIGHTLLNDRAENEAVYYDYPGAPLAGSVFPASSGLVPWPYGGFYLEAMDSLGGWIASAVDLMRFITSVDGHPQRPDLLKPSTISLMVARPGLADWKNSSWYYALGWAVRPQVVDANWWHAGSLPGTETIIVRTYHGMSWAALFNSRPQDWETFSTELDNSLWEAVNGITNWPDEDLFTHYPEE